MTVFRGYIPGVEGRAWAPYVTPTQTPELGGYGQNYGQSYGGNIRYGKYSRHIIHSDIVIWAASLNVYSRPGYPYDGDYYNAPYLQAESFPVLEGVISVTGVNPYVEDGIDVAGDVSREKSSLEIGPVLLSRSFSVHNQWTGYGVVVE